MNKNGSIEQRVEDIFELHRFIVSIFIKGFEDNFSLPEELNFTHVRAALILRFHGSMAMSELSRRLVLEKGSFTPVASMLIKKGYMKKEQSAEDKRVFNLALTQAGLDLTSRFKTEHWKFMSDVLGKLNPQEQQDYFAIVCKLNDYHRMIKGTPAESVE